MRILIISSYLPYPLFSGGHVRLYNLIKELSRKHKITLVCEMRDYQTESDIKQIEKICERVITVPRKKQWSVENIIKTALSKYPFLLVGHTSQEMKRHIVQLLNEQHYDLLHVETFYVFHNVPKTYLPIVLVEHNIEYLVYQRYAYTARFYLLPFLFLDIQKIKYWEKYFWKKATKLIAVSEYEKSIMKHPDVTVVPNGVDLTKFKIQSSKFKMNKKEKRILFMGDFKWIQNKKAAEKILKEIWPILRGKGEGGRGKLKLWIVGKKIPEDLKILGDKDVIFDEKAPDETWKIYQKADVLLAPITVGGGTSYKILESMASGLPVVTTQLGIEGIGAKHMKEALIAENSEEQAKLVLEVLQDISLYEKIATNARKLIEEKYSWKEIAKTLDDVYQSAVK